MLDPQTPTTAPAWQKADLAWREFVQRHPELGLHPGRWGLYNFLRPHKEPLLRADALRLARNRFWLAHTERFCDAAFECATGRTPKPASPAEPKPSPALPAPARPSTWVVARQVRCHGLSADEYFRLHGALPPAATEQLLDAHSALLTLADAVRELLPALEWFPDTVPEPDRARLAEVQRLLQEVDHGLL